MVDRISALGNYLVKKTSKNFDFKIIKGDFYFKGVLFTIGNDNYLVSDKEEELNEVKFRMSNTRFSDYPAKFAKKYTHMRFVKAVEKKNEPFVNKGKKYFIVTL